MVEEQRRREEAERERDELRRELFARREPRESPQTVEEEPERAEPTLLREMPRRARSDGPGGGSGGRPSPKIPRVWNATTCARLLRFLAAYVASMLPKGNSNPAQPHPDAIRPCPSWGACYRELWRITRITIPRRW